MDSGCTNYLSNLPYCKCNVSGLSHIKHMLWHRQYSHCTTPWLYISYGFLMDYYGLLCITNNPVVTALFSYSAALQSSCALHSPAEACEACQQSYYSYLHTCHGLWSSLFFVMLNGGTWYRQCDHLYFYLLSSWIGHCTWLFFPILLYDVIPTVLWTFPQLCDSLYYL